MVKQNWTCYLWASLINPAILSEGSCSFPGGRRQQWYFENLSAKGIMITSSALPQSTEFQLKNLQCTATPVLPGFLSAESEPSEPE